VTGGGVGVDYVMASTEYCYTQDWTVTEDIEIRRGFPLKMPGPGLTLTEKRAHLDEALHTWMCGPETITMVENLIGEDVNTETILDDVCAGIFPVGRMYLVIRRLDAYSGFWGVRDVCLLCHGICIAALDNKECLFNDDIKNLVLGFVDVDLLPTGETVRDLWNQSPFEPLRNAAPLSETETEVNLIRPSVDDQIDSFLSSFGTYSMAFLAFMVTYCIAIVQSGGIPKY